MQHQQAPKPQQAPQQHQEMIHQEFFVPFRQINQVQKNALAEATAMAKMKDGFFEVVVNIQRFEPEEIKVYLEGQAVMVTAEKKQGNIVCDSYEQKISLPADVDTDRLTSGISRDGILMIRVPRRRSPDRIIPIQFDAKISAVEKAIQKSVQIESMTAEQVQNDLQAANVEAIKIETEEDAVKAASAELIESLTVGVAEQAGAEAGEEAGSIVAPERAQASLADATAKAAGLALAARIAEETGRDVGRVSGAQAAAMAA